MFLRLNIRFLITVASEEIEDLYKESLNIGDPFDIIILDLIIKGGIGGEEIIKNILAIISSA